MHAQTTAEPNQWLAEDDERTAFRDYSNPEIERVRQFYRTNHIHQTYDFVLQKKRQWLAFDQRTMTPWAALDYLNTLVDESDPDINLPQISHLLQTAEAIRADGHPDWFVLTGFIHDLGKVLCLFGEPQWSVVGDTFPVGCRHSDKIVFSEFFALNPDHTNPQYDSPCGVYTAGCGLSNIHMSWGHDEYLYHLLKDCLPEPALYMIRYHSFYAWHREGQYTQLTDATDRANLPWVQKFNPYDLYSKNPNPPVLSELKPYYEDLMAKYLPAELHL
jgi:inositol oxygenase